MLRSFIERWPAFGIVASFTGVGTSVITFVHAMTPILSLAGALFGFFAGFYTFLIQRHKWLRESVKPTDPDLQS